MDMELIETLKNLLEVVQVVSVLISMPPKSLIIGFFLMVAFYYYKKKRLSRTCGDK